MSEELSSDLRTGQGEQKSPATALESNHMRRLSAREWSNFCRQLAVMLKSGVPLVDALQTSVEAESKNGNFSRLVRYLEIGVTEGEPIHSLLENAKIPYRSMSARMIEVAEATGRLDIAFSRIAEHCDQRQKFKNQIINILAYPALTALVAAGVVLFLFIYVIPRLVTVFKETNALLPLPTRLLVGFGQIAGVIALFGIALILTLVLVHAAVRRGRRYQRLVARSVITLPLIGRLVQQSNFIRYAFTLSDMLQAGIPFLEAMQLARTTIGNSVMNDDFQSVEQAVLRGEKLAGALRELHYVTPVTRRILIAAEEAGRLDQGFREVAETLQADFENHTRLMVSLLEPGIIVVMSLLVGFIAISILLPIFELSGLVV